ncbi:outer membrane lipoprotein-sorting protein [Undibacterium luofuense]|uniref:outer membrane lipoprotein-sorting protein n=1 Tax=Undibacterium luofuense TaxID=2828733 RepID=UPI0030EF22FE
MTRYAQWLLRYRIAVIAVTLVVTGVLGFFGAGLKVIIDPATLAPQGHPYIQATNHVDKVFGSKYLMLIGISAREGDVFQPAVLESVERITRKLETLEGVNKSTLLSLAARPAKAIRGVDDGLEVKPLLEKTRLSPDEVTQMKAALAANPVYQQTVVSADYKTAAIMVELKERSDGFQKMVEPVKAVVEAEAGKDVVVTFGGNPVYLDQTEKFAERINILFPIALLVIGLLHFEAFRTKQGLILPLVTALMAVMWATGMMGMSGQQMDIFNSPTPILILAIAAGHAVQLLKRYYEEYELLRKIENMSPVAANREAVIRSLAGVGPVMMIAGGVAALGFFSLLVFEIESIRAFGIFTGSGVLSAVVLEMTFIPAVRSMLKPPSDADRATEKKLRIWDRIPRWIAEQVISPARRNIVFASLAALLVVFGVGMNKVVVDNATKNFFAEDLTVQKDDDFLNRQLGGTNSLYIMVEGKSEDTLKDPAVLKAIESTQRYAESQEYVGKTLSIVDYLKRMNRAMHADQAQFDQLPESRELISQYLLLYSISGEPGDFDSVVDTQYKAGKITILLKTGSNAYIKQLVNNLQAHTQKAFGPDIKVSFGGDVAQTIALTDTMVKGKILNIVQIALAIFVVSALAFRSFTAGFIVLLPLVMAVAAVFGVMGMFGIPLNIPNSLISAMAVGIGADYAIYLLYRMREQVASGQDEATATRETLATAGKAALFVATAVAGGYGVLALSFGYNVHKWLSLFIVLAMVVSAWASLTLVPGTLLMMKPRFIFESHRQRPWWQLLIALGLGSALLLSVARMAHAETLTPAEIMRKNLAATKVRDSVAEATFTLTAKDGSTRVRKTTGYTRLQANGNDNMRLVRFNAPADIKGTASLLIERSGADDDMWIYLPALGKVRRLSASNKKDAFVGTDFSYADVIGYKVDEWKHKLLREENVDGVAHYVIESLPETAQITSQTGYSRRISWVRKDNFVASKGEAYDAGGQLLKKFVQSDIRAAGSNGKWQAMLSEAENVQTGHKTSIRLQEFKADQNVAESLFSARELEK